MAKVHRSQAMFSYRDVAAALVKHGNLHEGYFRVALTFGQVAAVNANINGRILPAAFLPVLGLSLVRDEEPSELTVDAATVNPASRILAVN